MLLCLCLCLTALHRPRVAHMMAKQHTRQPAPLLEGQEIEVECERIAYGGLGIARTSAGVTVMLSDAVHGEHVRAVVTRQRRRHVEAQTIAVLVPGPASAKPPWPAAFAACGGCQLQRMAYSEQLKVKRQWVRASLAPHPPVPVLRGTAAVHRALASHRSTQRPRTPPAR